MKIKPLKNYVLLKALEKDKTSKTGIILPYVENKEDSERGEVIEVGREVSEHIKVDNIVIFSLSTSTVKNDKDVYYIVREEDILAVIIKD